MRTIEKWNKNGIAHALKQLSPRLRQDVQQHPAPKGLIMESRYIYGPTHSGKTVLMAHMYLQAMQEAYLKAVPYSILFINISDLFQQIKQTYNKESQLIEQDLLIRYGRCDILFLDELGVEKSTEWVMDILYNIINTRYEQLLPMVITSNFSLKQLAAKLNDDRITSRIERMCIPTIKKPF